MTLTKTADRLPVLGVCGYSGSGKTTLIESVLPQLVARNLKVAVVKHDVHTIEVDRPGKDSDRLFQAGADVFLQGREALIRLHGGASFDLVTWLQRLGREYDLILVEGFKQSPLPKVWLLGEGESQPPDGVEGILAVFARGEDQREKFMAFLTDWLSEFNR